MALMAPMINMPKLLADQQAAFEEKVDNKAAETQAHVTSKTTETKSHVTSKNTETKNLVTAENDATQSTLANISTGDDLNANTAAVNAKVTEQADRVISSMAAPFNLPTAQASATSVLLKFSPVNSHNASNSGFYTTMDAESSINQVKGAYLNAVDVTTRQELISVTGKGTLTHVISPSTGARGDIDIIVTKDGKEHVFKFFNVENQRKALLGGFVQQQVINVHYPNSTGLGSSHDYGWATTAVFLALSPEQALFNGIGLDFDHSLVVEVVMHEGVTNSNNYRSGGVTYVER